MACSFRAASRASRSAASSRCWRSLASGPHASSPPSLSARLGCGVEARGELATSGSHETTYHLGCQFSFELCPNTWQCLRHNCAQQRANAHRAADSPVPP